MEKFELQLWKEWIAQSEAALNRVSKKSLDYIPAQYKNHKDNVPSLLDTQLKMLKNIGFRDVAVFYKYGMFALFGGQKTK